MIIPLHLACKAKHQLISKKHLLKMWIQTYLCAGGVESRMMRQSEALCVFKPFSALLLHVLSKTALLSAPQAVRCEVWSEWGGGGACVKREKAQKRKGREGERAEGREGERMMGQVWNLHTPPVAHTIGIRALVWWVTLVMVKVRENVAFWVSSLQANLLSFTLSRFLHFKWPRKQLCSFFNEHFATGRL